jgi:hypothetical protein
MDDVKYANIKDAEHMAMKLQARAEKLTRGDISSANLAEMGHPYKRKRRWLTVRQKIARAFIGTPGLLPINIQTGNLRRNMFVYVKPQGFRAEIWLRDRAKYASFQLDPENRGTTRMRPRGFWLELLNSYRQYALNTQIRIMKRNGVFKNP